LALYGPASHAALAGLGSFERAGAEADDCELGDGGVGCLLKRGI